MRFGKFTAIFVVFLLFVRMSFGQNSEKYFADTQKSSISYTGSHPMHDWLGVSNTFQAVFLMDTIQKKILNVAVVVRPESFNSGNANRDSHALEVLESLKYPKISFKSTEIAQAGDEIAVKGILKFHGVEKEISFVAKRHFTAPFYQIDGRFSIALSDYGIEIPSLMGIPVSNAILVEFDLYFKR